MKVKELIKKLSEFNPETEVYVNADHGQTNIKCSGAYLYYCEKGNKDDYYLDDYINPCDLNEYLEEFECNENELVEVCVVSD